MVRAERIRYKDQLGLTMYIHPDYINLRLDNGRLVSLVAPSEVEFIMPVDTTQPLEVNGGRAVSFITETSEGYLLVGTNPANSLADGWIIFDKAGKFIRSNDGRGTALTLRNKVVDHVVYQRLGQVAKGYVMSTIYSTEADARAAGKQVIKITSRGYRVISVELLN